MSKPATVFKRSTNLLLQFLAENVAVGEMLPTEQYLTTICQGSRTAVRSAIAYLSTRRLISSPAERRLHPSPRECDPSECRHIRRESHCPCYAT